jgi:hypothetical protein
MVELNSPDTNNFLRSIGEGRSLVKYRKNAYIFR